MIRSRRGPRPAGGRTPLAAPLLALLIPLVPVFLAGCVPRVVAGSLPPTLSLETAGAGQVAMEDGIPVPTFGFQPRARLDLDGPWRVQRTQLDSDLSLTDRSVALKTITANARGRQTAGFDDDRWSLVDVPGSYDPPPGPTQSGAWYRRTFEVPVVWQGQAVTLKFGAVEYLADVWLNGHYLGYHEGGFTPFAFDASKALNVGGENLLAVRVDDPAWGSRDDIVPWGLADWWDYGGITQPVWLEASPPLMVVRADVVPHLDGADVNVVFQNRGDAPARGTASVEILPTLVDATNLLDPDARRLVPPFATAIASKQLDPQDLAAGAVAVSQASFVFDRGDTWRPDRPALYVLHVTVTAEDGATDELYDTFGLRHIAVDPDAPRILLNGTPTTFAGVALHDERLIPGGSLGADGAVPISVPVQALDQLLEARKVGATLVRTGHTPANPMLLMLADRLGLAVWEEIPLYHFTPRTFGIAMGRGIPQQMLREMTLRDMNHPSVMFYGLANESTGGGERTSALAALRDATRQLDGTRLTGQAAYGWDPTDPTSDPLDVAGYTFYYGVFYGSDVARDTAAALAAAHERYPKKPLMILEFGRWADPPDGLVAQVRVMRATGGELVAASADREGGYVSGLVWWALQDYYTLRPGIELERFGLFGPDGMARPAADAAVQLFAAATGGSAAQSATQGGLGTAGTTGRSVVSGGRAHPADSTGGSVRFLGFLGYGLLVTVALLGAVLGGSIVSLRLQERRARSAGRSPW